METEGHLTLGDMALQFATNRKKPQKVIVF